MTKDLGTYHLKVELMDGQGWIQEWETGARYMKGSVIASTIISSCHPLDASRIDPPYKDEQDLFESMCFMYLEGNYSCDCNKALHLARANREEDPKYGFKCGSTIKLKRLTVIRPDGTEKVIWEQ